MNKEQIASILRQVVLFLGGLAVGRGLITADMLSFLDANVFTGLAGLLATGIASFFALRNRSDKQIVVSAAEKVPVSAPSQAKVGIEIPVAVVRP